MSLLGIKGHGRGPSFEQTWIPSPSHKDALCQVWMKLAQRLWRKNKNGKSLRQRRRTRRKTRFSLQHRWAKKKRGGASPSSCFVPVRPNFSFSCVAELKFNWFSTCTRNFAFSNLQMYSNSFHKIAKKGKDLFNLKINALKKRRWTGGGGAFFAWRPSSGQYILSPQLHKKFVSVTSEGTINVV